MLISQYILTSDSTRAYVQRPSALALNDRRSGIVWSSYGYRPALVVGSLERRMVDEGFANQCQNGFEYRSKRSACIADAPLLTDLHTVEVTSRSDDVVSASVRGPTSFPQPFTVSLANHLAINLSLRQRPKRRIIDVALDSETLNGHHGNMSACADHRPHT